MKVIRVTKDEFELEDGRIFQHVSPLDEEISPEEFQEHLDKWFPLVTGNGRE